MTPRAIPHFLWSELQCPCCRRRGMNARTLERLEAARLIYGKPITIASAYRCPKKNGVDVLHFDNDPKLGERAWMY